MVGKKADSQFANCEFTEKIKDIHEMRHNAGEFDEWDEQGVFIFGAEEGYQVAVEELGRKYREDPSRNAALAYAADFLIRLRRGDDV